MTGEVGMAISQQRLVSLMSSFTLISPLGPWLELRFTGPADCTYYLQRLRLLTKALVCSMLARLFVCPGKSVPLTSQVSLSIIYSEASCGLIPPDLFEAAPLKSILWASIPHPPTADSPSAETEDFSLHDCLPPSALSARPPTPRRQKTAEMATVRFASGAIPSTSKLEAGWLLKAGGIQHRLLLWRELLWEQSKGTDRGNEDLRWGENSVR